MTLQAAQTMREPHFHQWWREKVEKGDTGKKEAIGGKAGHESEQTARTQKKIFPMQSGSHTEICSALFCLLNGSAAGFPHLSSCYW